MMFNRKTLKGVRGVIASRDLEKYLEQILILERRVRQKDIKIAILESELNSLKIEQKHLKKVTREQEGILHFHRNDNADLKLQLQSLKDRSELLEREKKEQVGELRKELDILPNKTVYLSMKKENERMAKELQELKRLLERRESQIRRMTEENLKLKDKLKFLKA
ncbi:MAG: hypothetical protein ACTSUE_22070 [Promethearchaeota archaeon]